MTAFTLHLGGFFYSKDNVSIIYIYTAYRIK